MTNEGFILAGTAAGIGFLHTILGPDHYLPFIALSKARGWSGRKTAMVTTLCGLGHVMSSMVLGLAGLFLGVMVFKLESLESFRGDLAGWLLMAFGCGYLLWGLHIAARQRRHEHRPATDSRQMTPWVIFIIFVFGPCEPLIPLIMYPAAKQSMATVALVALLFAATTIATMLASVMVLLHGLSRMSFPRAENFSHALAGLAILVCGGTVTFLGL